MIFVSYARADGSETSGIVQKQLELGGFDVWRDVRNIDALSDFSVEIERAIEKADAMVVCVTASISESPDSFVRREILYAQAKKRRIVPIRVGSATMPILINQLTWIEAAHDDTFAGLAQEVRRRLALRDSIEANAAGSAIETFVRSLIDDILDYLESTVEALLEMAAVGASENRVAARGGLPRTMQPIRLVEVRKSFTPGLLGQACVQGYERMLLSGGAGSGKTTALLVAAREAANRWLEDQTRRFPIFCRAADWNAATDEPLSAWLSRSSTTLPEADLQAPLASGRIALFIDGLDELGPRVIRGEGETKTSVDPRSELLAKLPPQVSALVSSRSEALEEVRKPAEFEIYSLQSLAQEQIQEYLTKAPKLAELLAAHSSFAGLVQTPLVLGLLSFVANSGQVPLELSGVGELSPALQVIHLFAVNRWQYESRSGASLVSPADLLVILGRVATRHGQVFARSDITSAIEESNVDAAAVIETGLNVGLIRSRTREEFAFFHPLFADYYATLHCRRNFGEQSSDGWDVQLFYRIGELGDQSFVPLLIKLATDSFWRGEFGEEIVFALTRLGDPHDNSVISALLRLLSLGMFHAVLYIPSFALRCTPEVQSQFVLHISRLPPTPWSAESLLRMGKEGLEALVRVYDQLDKNDSMRPQIEGYVLVRDYLARRRATN